MYTQKAFFLPFTKYNVVQWVACKALHIHTVTKQKEKNEGELVTRFLLLLVHNLLRLVNLPKAFMLQLGGVLYLLYPNCPGTIL